MGFGVTRFEIGGLAPDTPYLFRVSREEIGVRTAPSTNKPFTFLAYSCNQPFFPDANGVRQDRANSLLLLRMRSQGFADAPWNKKPISERPSFQLAKLRGAKLAR
jgi:hypothetical protein